MPVIAIILMAWPFAAIAAALVIAAFIATGAREMPPVTPPRQPDPEEAEFAAWIAATRRPS